MKIINMFEFRRVLVTLVILCYLGVCNTCFSERSATGSMSREEMYKKENPEIVLYGKVVDQFGQPVEGAKVAVRRETIQAVMEYHDLPYIIVETDENGRFLTKTKGISMSISDIKKDAYEFDRLNNPSDSYECTNWDDKKVSFSDSENPVIFQIRKRNKPAFLYKIETGLVAHKNKITEMNVSLRGRWLPLLSKAMTQEQIEHKDIKISIKASEDGKKFDISFLSLDENSGIIISDELLHEAPEKGYMSEVHLARNRAKDSRISKIYLYVKSQGGQRYSRLKVEFNVQSDFLRVKIRGYSNNDGSRNLDMMANTISKNRCGVKRFVTIAIKRCKKQDVKNVNLTKRLLLRRFSRIKQNVIKRKRRIIRSGGISWKKKKK